MDLSGARLAPAPAALRRRLPSRHCGRTLPNCASPRLAATRCWSSVSTAARTRWAMLSSDWRREGVVRRSIMSDGPGRFSSSNRTAFARSTLREFAAKTPTTASDLMAPDGAWRLRRRSEGPWRRRATASPSPLLASAHAEASRLRRRRISRHRLRLQEGPRSGRRVEALPAAALEERLQDLRARHGRAARRHGQRGRALPRGLQEVGAGAGRRHGAATIGEDFFRAHSIAGSTRLTSAELRARWAGWRSRSSPSPATRTSGASAGTRRSTASARRLRAAPPERDVLLLLGPLVERGGVPAAAGGARLRHRQHPQLLVLLPQRLERRARRGLRLRHRVDRARRPRAAPTWRWSSAPTRRRTTRGSSPSWSRCASAAAR